MVNKTKKSYVFLSQAESVPDYRQLRNHVFLLHSEKTKFFNSLSRSHSSKKLVKLLWGGKYPIPNLTEGDVQAVTDVDKANVLNTFFCKVLELF